MNAKQKNQEIIKALYNIALQVYQLNYKEIQSKLPLNLQNSTLILSDFYKYVLILEKPDNMDKICKIEVDTFKCEFEFNRVFDIMQKFSKIEKIPASCLFNPLNKIEKIDTLQCEKYTSNDKMYEKFTYIYVDHKQGFQVATNTNILKAVAIEKNENLENYYINSKGFKMEFNLPYPNYLAVIPSQGYKIHIPLQLFKIAASDKKSMCQIEVKKECVILTRTTEGLETNTNIFNVQNENTCIFAMNNAINKQIFAEKIENFYISNHCLVYSDSKKIMLYMDKLYENYMQPEGVSENIILPSDYVIVKKEISQVNNTNIIGLIPEKIEVFETVVSVECGPGETIETVESAETIQPTETTETTEPTEPIETTEPITPIENIIVQSIEIIKPIAEITVNKIEKLTTKFIALQPIRNTLNPRKFNYLSFAAGFLFAVIVLKCCSIIEKTPGAQNIETSTVKTTPGAQINMSATENTPATQTKTETTKQQNKPRYFSAETTIKTDVIIIKKDTLKIVEVCTVQKNEVCIIAGPEACKIQDQSENTIQERETYNQEQSTAKVEQNTLEIEQTNTARIETNTARIEIIIQNIKFFLLKCNGTIQKTDLKNSYYFLEAQYVPKEVIIQYLQSGDIQILEFYE